MDDVKTAETWASTFPFNGYYHVTLMVIININNNNNKKKKLEGERILLSKLNLDFILDIRFI
jgi:hypothetical protein